MPTETAPLGRRERNKQAKLERIVAAAGALFAEHGVDEVTTQQIADAADIGTGTLFLYAKTKGELLLLVQNSLYAGAHERGLAAAANARTALDGMMALLTPVIECNRAQVENGRTYLREMAFGDPTEPHHAAALSIAGETERALAETLTRLAEIPEAEASVLAHVATSILFVSMASRGAEAGVAEIVESVRTQIAAILPR
ncbi:TetR/AcrR family transcriptional regulator [Microbacterium sp. NPDC090225]|uniref:TetR/AcrR family transcriptional regulator n=1 Tax=Microbacterium sp. NPDC090225 TaxID=3364207 RepID=UPI0038170F97